ncbi:MAG: SH3 domain-containing protein [Anaerolineales bacterium]|jgi:hypothetical protein
MRDFSPIQTIWAIFKHLYNRYFIWFGLLLLIGLILLHPLNAQAGDMRQQPTPSIATVTSTPSGPIARAVTDQDQINVRSGPSVDYALIGVLLPGQQVPVIGRTPGGDWVQVSYPGVPGNVGWVFSSLLVIPPNSGLPIIEPPATPTPQMTPTIDPTLAAQFIVEVPATRLPTFTPPPDLVIPTFEPVQTGVASTGIPMGLPIIILGVIGLFGALIAILRGR